MGYESKIYIVNVCDYAQEIATVDMSKMPLSFHRLFNDEFCGEVWDGKRYVSEDCYGDRLKCADVQAVIDWLEKEIVTDDYRRLPVLLGLLKGIRSEQWDDIQVVHYGY